MEDLLKSDDVAEMIAPWGIRLDRLPRVDASPRMP
jgi:hypothetical protein